MALFNFPFRAPSWPKINAVDSTEQSTIHQSEFDNRDTNRKCLDTLLTKLAQTDLAGAEQLKAYLCQQYRRNFKTNTMRNAYHDRKAAQTNTIVAARALSNKLARVH